MSIISFCACRIASRTVIIRNSTKVRAFFSIVDYLERSVRWSSTVSSSRVVSPPLSSLRPMKKISRIVDEPPGSRLTLSFVIKIQVVAGISFLLLITMFYIRKWTAGRMDEYVLPMEFEDFIRNYLAKEEVEFIRYHLAFQVADVYMLHSLDDRKVIEEESYLPSWAIGHIPDVRFRFRGSERELKNQLQKAMDSVNKKGVIDLRTQNYPDVGDASIVVVAFLLMVARLLRSHSF